MLRRDRRPRRHRPPTTPPPATGCGTANVALSKPATASSAADRRHARDAQRVRRQRRHPLVQRRRPTPQWLAGRPRLVAERLQGRRCGWEGAYGKTFTVQTSTNGTSGFTTIGYRHQRHRRQAVGRTSRQPPLRPHRSAPPAAPATATRSGRCACSPAPARRPPRRRRRPDARAAGRPPPTRATRTSARTRTCSHPHAGRDLQNTVERRLHPAGVHQFGTERDQFLFEPGTYDVQAQHRLLHVDQRPRPQPRRRQHQRRRVGRRAVVRRQRDAELLALRGEPRVITPSTGEARWAVSQAAPCRRIHVKGDLSLDPRRTAGPRAASSPTPRSTARSTSASQQQWYTRDSSARAAGSGSVWNMVFSGVTRRAGDRASRTRRHTVLDTTPISGRSRTSTRTNGRLGGVRPEPAHRTHRRLVAEHRRARRSRLDSSTSPSPVTRARRSTRRWRRACTCCFTPGVYHLDQTINVTGPNTVVLGLGYGDDHPGQRRQTACRSPTWTASRSPACCSTGRRRSRTRVLEVGTAGNHADRAGNPQSAPGRVHPGRRRRRRQGDQRPSSSTPTTRSSTTSGRGVPTTAPGVGWTENIADYGLVVNGNDVNGYGLFVEHYQKYNLLWNGERGRVDLLPERAAVRPAEHRRRGRTTASAGTPPTRWRPT